MTKAKLFNNGRSQAVRLPKECRFRQREVCVAKLGDAVILYPADKGWDLMERAIAEFTSDFMSDREQPKHLERRARL